MKYVMAGATKTQSQIPLPMLFQPVSSTLRDVLFGQSLFDFLTAWFKCLGDFLMKFAYRAEGDINPEQGLGKLLTPSSGHPMYGGEVGQKSSEPGTESGSSLRRDIGPGDSAAGTFHTAQSVFTDVGLMSGISITWQRR